MSNTLKLAKNQAKAKQHAETEILLIEKYSLSSFTLSSKHNSGYSKKMYKKQVCLFKWGYIITEMKMSLKMKNRSHRYDINGPRTIRGHSYTRHKMCLNIMVVICIKQHLSNIWSSIHEKVNQQQGWVENKKVCN